MHTRTTTLMGLALALMALALSATATQAAGGHSKAKPPANTSTPVPTPAPLDGGTVYYYESNTTNMGMHAIDPDGTGDVLVPGIGYTGGTKPSRQQHHGERWFVALRDLQGVPGFFPGGASEGRLWELDLVRQSDLSRVPLTDFAGACIHLWGSGPGVRYDWAPAASGQIDGAISWIGTRWEDLDDNGSCDQPVEGGIFRGAVAIDGGGAVSFSQPTVPDVVVGLSGTSTRAAEFAWAPSGQQVAYKDSSGADLWVATVGGSRSMVFDGRVFSLFPISWSPDLDPITAGDQSRIAFAGALTNSTGSDTEWGTYTSAPNGSGRVRIVAGKLPKRSGDSSIVQLQLYWSPAGNQLLYTNRSYTYNPTAVTDRLHRVNANGTNAVLLVDANGSYQPVGVGWAMD